MSVRLEAFSEYIDRGVVFWDNDTGGIETSKDDGLDAAGFLFRYAESVPRKPENRQDGSGIDLNNLQLEYKKVLEWYFSARTRFFQEELAKVRAECPHAPGDVLRLKQELEGRGDSMVLDTIAGFLVDNNMGYVLIGRIIKPDGNAEKTSVIAFESDFVRKKKK